MTIDVVDDKLGPLNISYGIHWHQLLTIFTNPSARAGYDKGQFLSGV